MTERSRLACPACGLHRLAIIEFPEQRAVGYQPYSELIGMGEPTVVSPPSIGCLHCGTEWESLEAFQAASGIAGAGPGGEEDDGEGDERAAED